MLNIGAKTSSIQQEIQLWLTNRLTRVHEDVEICLTQNATKHSILCCAVKSRPLANDCDSLAGFSDIYLPFAYMTPFNEGIPSSYRVPI